MATLQNVITFRRKKCKVSGSAEISETDHPYSTETYVNDGTPGFLVLGAAFPDAANVRCEEFGKKVR